MPPKTSAPTAVTAAFPSKPTHAKPKKFFSCTTAAQQNTILLWLEEPDNFKLITGSAAFKQKIIAGTKLKKTDACKFLAEHVNKQTSASWIFKQGKTCYKLYFKRCKQTKAACETTRFGVTDNDEKQGIKTMDEKLEAAEEDVADNEDGGLSAIAEDATTSLEDVRNVEDANEKTAKCKLEPTTPQKVKKGQHSSSSTNSTSSSIISSSASKCSKHSHDFSSVFADAQDQCSTEAVECTNLEAEWHKDELQLKD
ncbi:hypothetical protein HK100_005925 [Physocladia obscura]|uniref:Uncharacterized protein n=1 Tax=Physocladia obscura TaxID=109957 RepID=A0AAD5ST50_9FUNG|nr:hypothetical protein HK100_005925 [Physocladia obscura]